ncbi:MAG: GtrA family protein [Coprobacillus cateniformis]|uniref:GtrA family protein n=1 Tax=Coprobacillus cateniformis TaxID=100884 RepID=UPI00399F6EB5
MRNMVKKLLYFLNTEGMRYIIVGGCTTFVNLLVFTFLCKVLNVNVNISNIVSVIVAILFAYVTNKIFVFQSHCKSYKELYLEFSKFIGARLLTMIIEVGGVFFLYELIGQNEIVAKLETQVIVLIGNYIISKFLVFKGKGDE